MADPGSVDGQEPQINSTERQADNQLEMNEMLAGNASEQLGRLEAPTEELDGEKRFHQVASHGVNVLTQEAGRAYGMPGGEDINGLINQAATMARRAYEEHGMLLDEAQRAVAGRLNSARNDLGDERIVAQKQQIETVTLDTVDTVRNITTHRFDESSNGRRNLINGLNGIKEDLGALMYRVGDPGAQENIRLFVNHMDQLLIELTGIQQGIGNEEAEALDEMGKTRRALEGLLS